LVDESSQNQYRIFFHPLRKGGVLRRTGHTEVLAHFARLAGFNLLELFVKSRNDDGTMVRLPELVEV
jgi:3,4-dihydroxy 2-butanone 4-phosphate synthase/GTP cyclohydrolase II